MKFRQYTPDLENIDKIIVDGNKCGIGIQLSHWPGNTTPAQFKADLSLEIVLRLLDSPAGLKHLSEYDLVTNDHYDTDGLLAVWALLNPTEARLHTLALKAAAQAGDFYEFTSPKAVQFDLLVRAFELPERSPLGGQINFLQKEHRWQGATEAIFAEMPDLLYEPERYCHLWADDYQSLLDRISFLHRGAVEVREWPSEKFSVICSEFPLNHFTRNIACKGHRILEVHKVSDGYTYELHYREFLWYDIVDRPRTVKHLLIRAAQQLNDLESPATRGCWGVTRWTPALRFVAAGPRAARIVRSNERLGHSSLPAETVERVIRQELRILDEDVPAIRD